MGYSIGIQARNPKLQQQMYNFMAKEYRSHWQVLGKAKEPCYTSSVLMETSYNSRNPNCLGIDYGSVGGFERAYAYALVRWMALRVGTRRKAFKELTLTKLVPCMFYDYEWNPVLHQPLKYTSKPLQQYCVDEYGVGLSPNKYSDFALSLMMRDQEKYLNTYAEACRKHGVGRDPQEGEPRGIRVKIHNTLMKMLWPDIQEELKPLREEMRRLSEAWVHFSQGDGVVDT